MLLLLSLLFPPQNSIEETKDSIRIPSKMELSLIAAEPLMANPVSFFPATDGSFFVCETRRQETAGIPDNRAHQYWIPDDLRAQTIEDRAAYYLKHVPEAATEWTIKEDRIVILRDLNGDGRADRSTVFADGFRELLDGTGAGVLNRGGSTWFTCIPSLWRFEDVNGDDRADQRTELHRGFGVRTALRGHDLHGLVFGPDGRLYFSIGDRGYNLRNQEGKLLKNPGSGAVFRCQPDGSELEIFATGLRNPQELAFDNYGNLWTGDNNSDAGDQARLVYVIEGGDCGWRMNWQYIPDRGPWMPEEWWKPHFPTQAAFLNPPIANVGSGPSGLTCAPGSGHPKELDNSLFMVDFLGVASGSGVRRLLPAEEGAGFRLDMDEEFVWNVLATDTDFSPNGSLILSDWVEGWVGANKGRLWRVRTTEADLRKEGEATARILAGHWSQQSSLSLQQLLGHADRRVRQEAHFELVRRGDLATLNKVAADRNAPFFARLHAVFGLTMAKKVRGLATLLNAGVAAPELRARMAAALGDAGDPSGSEWLVRAVNEDLNPRVRYFAALSCGKLGQKEATPALIELLASTGNTDRWLRHAAALSLSRILSEEELGPYAGHPLAAVRMGVVLALRHQRSAKLADFLLDSEPSIATEAARAVYDLPIVDALPALAEQLAGPDSLEPFHLRRALHAAWLMGRDRDALTLQNFLQQDGDKHNLREQACQVAKRWGEREGFDILHNEWRVRRPQTPQWFADKNILPTKDATLNAVARGRKIFLGNTAASCVRCHAVQGVTQGLPSEVGPDLSSIGLFLDQQELREAILNPTASIAPGYALFDTEGKTLPVSAMTPTMDKLLNPTEIADLVSWLATLRQPKKLVVHVESRGFTHDVARPNKENGGLSLVEKTWLQWAEEDERFFVEINPTSSVFSKEKLAATDAIFFYTTGELELPPEGKESFVSWLESGGGFVGSHCASDTFYQWPWYGEMLGGWFDGHPWHQQVTIRVEDPIHPATSFLGNSFSITDEIYQFKNWSREGKRVLLSLDLNSVDSSRPSIQRQDRDFAISWIRRQGRGGVFYTGLGHRPEVWTSSRFRQHLVEGMLWTARH